MFRRHPGRLLKVLRTFNLRPVSAGIKLNQKQGRRSKILILYEMHFLNGLKKYQSKTHNKMNRGSFLFFSFVKTIQVFGNQILKFSFHYHLCNQSIRIFLHFLPKVFESCFGPLDLCWDFFLLACLFFDFGIV